MAHTLYLTRFVPEFAYVAASASVIFMSLSIKHTCKYLGLHKIISKAG